MKKTGVLMLGMLILLSSGVFAKEPLKWVTTDYAPAYYQTETGEVKGYLYEIAIEALEKRMEIPVEISFYPWKRCQLLVQEGHADMIFTIPTPERMEYAVTHTTPAWIKKRILYTYAGHPRMAEINQLNSLEAIKQGDFSLVTYLGNGWFEANVKPLEIPVEFTNTPERVYEMLAQKRGDLIIEETGIANTNLKNLGLTEKVVPTEGVAEESNFHLIIGKKSAYVDIIPQLNTVIEEMWQDGTIERILAEYDL